MVCATPRLVLPASPILVEIIDWRRIGITVVEISDFRGDFGSCDIVVEAIRERLERIASGSASRLPSR